MNAKFYWKCTKCNIHSINSFDSATDAARNGVQQHSAKTVIITSKNDKYIGLAEGLLFHCGKNIQVPVAKKRKKI